MRLATILFLVLGALPLILYPVVLLANEMSFAAPATGSESLLQWLVSRAFLLGSIIYPIVYLFCAVVTIIRLVKDRGRTALRYSLHMLV